MDKEEMINDWTFEETVKTLKVLWKEKTMAQWNKNTVPTCQKKDCSDEVLVTVEKVGSKGQVYRNVLKAVYIPDHHCTLEDMGWNMPEGALNWEYSEEDDSYWIPQGWYEVCEYFHDYTYCTITDKITAWMKLPKAYEPNVKQFGSE